ncbi:MAG: S41 family peptidase [Acidobacteriota bacterium]
MAIRRTFRLKPTSTQGAARTRWAVLAGALFLAFGLSAPTSGEASGALEGPSPVERLDEVADLVAEHFYDPDLRGLDWPALRADHARRIRSGDDPAVVIQDLLRHLDTSHTRYLTDREPAYYQLLAIFEGFLRESSPELFRQRFGDGPIRYPGIGLFTEAVDGKMVVAGVLSGAPAAEAGVLRGDVLVAVDGSPYRPVASFTEVGRPHRLTIERTADGPPLHLDVVPEMLEPATLFLDAMRSGAKAVNVGGKGVVAYVPVWSYAGKAYHDLLEELILFGGPLSAADALVLDLRGGWGGANPQYLTLFSRAVPTLTVLPRNADPRDVDSQWRKPVVALVDGSSRSGKEILAHGFRRHGIGPVVGGRTAGAVTAGRVFPLMDGSLLYLAVADVRVDGLRLEGVGVEPDIAVEPELLHAAGADPQKRRALEEAAGLVRPKAE